MDWVKSHPWWAVGIAGVVLLGIWWYESHKSASSPTTVGTTPTTTTTTTTRHKRHTTTTPTTPVPPVPPMTPTPHPQRTTPVPPVPPTPRPTPRTTTPTTHTTSTTHTLPTTLPTPTSLPTPTIHPALGGAPITTTTTTPEAPAGTVTTTAQLASAHLSRLGYNPSAAAAIATQIAAANSGVRAGTPQLVTGIPVVAGSTAPVGSNGMTPMEYAAQKAAAAAAAAKKASSAAPFSIPAGQTYVGGTQQQYDIAQSLTAPASAYTIQNGYWVSPQGQDIAKVNPNAFIGSGPNAANMLPL